MWLCLLGYEINNKDLKKISERFLFFYIQFWKSQQKMIKHIIEGKSWS